MPPHPLATQPAFTSDLFINFAIATYTVFYAQFITHQDMHLNNCLGLSPETG